MDMDNVYEKNLLYMSHVVGENLPMFILGRSGL